MAKSQLRMVRSRPPTFNTIDAMSPGDLLHRLSVVSPELYRAIIKAARESYRKVWPFPSDPLQLTKTGTD
jgi:hypothetical protein